MKNDRRFPPNAINYCLEQAGISQHELTAVVYYDNSALPSERLRQSLMAVDRQAAARMWKKMMPSWLWVKNSFAIVADFARDSSPIARCKLLCLVAVRAGRDPDDRWRGRMGHGQHRAGAGNRVELLKEVRFPHSLGLLYSAYTQFTGFQVNSGASTR